MKGIIKLGIILLSCLSFGGLSADFQIADKLFALRGQEENLLKAKKIYREIIEKSKVSSERIYAFDRYARLSVLQAELGPYVYGKATKKPAQVFEECISLSNKLNKESLGFVSPEYVYWRATCIGLWANNSNMLAITFKLSLLNELSELIEYGQQKFPDFERGGFSMMAAGLRIRSRLLKVLNIYNPAQAISLLEQMEKRGVDDYMVLFMKAEAQNALGKRDEARATLQEAIAAIEDRNSKGNLNPLFDVESQGVLYMLNQSKKNLTFSGFAPAKVFLK